MEQLAGATFPVLVHGESGVGKDVVAKEIHARSSRRGGPFVSLNCASIPDSRLDAVLYGHRHDPSTGQEEQEEGVFDQAHGGTLFLDDIGELSVRGQAALVRAFETRCTRGALGSTGTDVRVVSATHRNLTRMTQHGAFREDLLFRINTMIMRIAPLRERRNEIDELAACFLEAARMRWNTIPLEIGPTALALLREFDWPGNIRQLKNVVERAAVTCRSKSISLNDLPDFLACRTLERTIPPVSAELPTTGWDASCTELSLPDRVRIFESQLIRDALAKSGGSHAKAAILLGIPRRTLSSKIQTLNIEQGMP
jgi:DNA-binding NtrC family response regulator